MLLVIYGNTGTGKTTLAMDVASKVGACCVELNALTDTMTRAASRNPAPDEPPTIHTSPRPAPAPLPVAVPVAAALWVVEAQLAIGHRVIFTCPSADIDAQRLVRRFGQEHDIAVRWVQTVCSDPAELRRRLTRHAPPATADQPALHEAHFRSTEDDGGGTAPVPRARPRRTASLRVDTLLPRATNADTVVRYLDPPPVVDLTRLP